MSVETELLDAVRDLTVAVQDLADRQPRAAYRIPAAAKRLDCSESHLARQIRRGAVATVPHMGSIVLVSHSELERIASSSSTSPSADVGVARPVERSGEGPPSSAAVLPVGRGSRRAG